MSELRLPDGWTTTFIPGGRFGADTVVQDASGAVVGSYGFIGSHRESAVTRGRWMVGGHQLASAQACIDYLVSRAAA